MKRFIALVLSLVMALSLCAPAWATMPAEGGALVAPEISLEGEGTEVSPYLVDTEAELAAAIEDGGYVKLTAGIALEDASLTVTGNTVIDLNSQTLSGYSTSSSTSYLIKVASGADLTLTGNGLLTFEAANPDVDWNPEGFPTYANNTIRCEGKLTVDGVTVENTTNPGGASYAIDCYPGADLVVESGVIDGCGKLAIRMFANSNTVSTNVTINGGTITGKRAVWIQLPSSNINNVRLVNLTITGGELICTNTEKDVCVYSYSYGDSFAKTDVTITGGTFTGDVCFGGGSKATVENVTITGGIFNGYLGRYLADDGWEDIAKPVYVASVAGKDYTSLQEAVNVGGNVTLLADVTLDATVVVNQNVVLDLNDKTITGQSGNNGFIFAVNDGASLTLKNGALVSSGYAVSSGGNGEKANTIVLDDVDISATSVGVYHNGSYYGVDVTVQNGTTINAANGAGIFLSGSAIWASADKMNKLTITDSTVKGGTAVEVKHGNVTVTNSTLTATEAVAERNSSSGNCTVGYALALTNNGMANAAEASSGTMLINSGNFTGKIGIKDDDTTAVVENTTTAKIQISGGTFSADPKAYVVDGYAATEVEGKYVVAVKKAGANKVETEVKVDVVAPSVEVPEVNTDGMNEEDKALVENVADTLEKPGAVEFDNTALVDAAAEAKTTVKNEVTAEEAADLLAEENIPVATNDKVNVVVQPYYDVKVESITVDEDGTASVAMNITPMYQTVVTTAAANEEIVTKDTAEVGEEVNAVAVGTPKEMTVTKPVTITVAIPKALAVSDGANGYKSLYVTHTKDNDTKYVYEAKVSSVGEDEDTAFFATFTNPNGFSSFTLSTVDSTAVTMNGMNYVDLQSAINDLGKGATIKVLSGKHTAVVSGSTSFKVVLENGATANITAANGYRVIKYLINGVYMYNVVEASAGGYYPNYPGTSSKPTTSKPIQSADTFDAGIALYVGMSVIGAVGTVALGKKRED